MTLNGLTKILSPLVPDKANHIYGPRKIMNKEGQDSILESNNLVAEVNTSNIGV